jgi:hypothetical protein
VVEDIILIVELVVETIIKKEILGGGDVKILVVVEKGFNKLVLILREFFDTCLSFDVGCVHGF